MAISPEETDFYLDLSDQSEIWARGGQTYIPGTDVPFMTEAQHVELMDYTYPVFAEDFHDGYFVHEMRLEVHYSLLEDIRTWFKDIHSWIWLLWGRMRIYFDDLFVYIESLWNNLATYISDLGTTIKDEILGLANFVSNIYTWVVWNLVDDVTTFVTNLFKPITDAWDSVVNTLIDFYNEIRDAIVGFLETPYEWMENAIADLWDWLKSIADSIWDSMLEAATLVGGYIGSKLTEFAPVVTELLRDVLLYLWNDIKTGAVFDLTKLAPAVWEAAGTGLDYLKDEFNNLIGLAYDEIIGYAKSYAPMTPEKSLELAGIMFGSAVGFGTMAHGMALAVEAVPNLKYMGVHYLSGFAAHMGAFGAISASTMGVIAALAVREPFKYYMNSLLRAVIPDEKLLIEFRSKREIDYSQFESYMRYHGYTDEWITKIDSWLWKDPRLFEILYCADVTVPPKEWLVRKFERAGYEDIDIETLVKVVERRTTRSPRTYYTTSLRRNFRHGFLSEEALVEGIRALEMAEDAIDWIKRTGELDNIYEVNQDWVTTFRTAYRNDIITEEECEASLSALGLPQDRVEGIIELEWVRKEPRILREERTEIQTEWRKIQSSYSRVYIESFRRGLIDENTLAANLIAIGIKNKVATMTARHEAIKLIPKSKPEAITIPLIPAPTAPPVYLD